MAGNPTSNLHRISRSIGERSKTLHSISIGEFDALTNSIWGLQSEEIEATEVIDHTTNTASVNAKLVSPPSVNLEIFCQNVQQAPVI